MSFGTFNLKYLLFYSDLTYFSLRRVTQRSFGAVTCYVIMKGDKHITFFVRVSVAPPNIQSALHTIIHQRMVPDDIVFLGPIHFSGKVAHRRSNKTVKPPGASRSPAATLSFSANSLTKPFKDDVVLSNIIPGLSAEDMYAQHVLMADVRSQSANDDEFHGTTLELDDDFDFGLDLADAGEVEDLVEPGVNNSSPPVSMTHLEDSMERLSLTPHRVGTWNIHTYSNPTDVHLDPGTDNTLIFQPQVTCETDLVESMEERLSFAPEFSGPDETEIVRFMKQLHPNPQGTVNNNNVVPLGNAAPVHVDDLADSMGHLRINPTGLNITNNDIVPPGANNNNALQQHQQLQAHIIQGMMDLVENLHLDSLADNICADIIVPPGANNNNALSMQTLQTTQNNSANAKVRINPFYRVPSANRFILNRTPLTHNKAIALKIII